MFVGRVERVKRGLLGPKFRTVYSAVGAYPEPILAEMSKFSDESHRKTFQDRTESLGDFRVPAQGVKVYDLEDFPKDMDADHVDVRAGRAYVVQDLDDDLPF